MPVTYVLDPDAGFIHTRCTGQVSFDEVVRHFQELERDDSLPERLDVLLDLEETQTLPASSQLQAVAGEVERLKSSVSWGAVAIVASRDALYGMSRMFQVFLEGQFEISHVFRERGAAEEWLESVRKGQGR